MKKFIISAVLVLINISPAQNSYTVIKHFNTSDNDLGTQELSLTMQNAIDAAIGNINSSLTLIQGDIYTTEGDYIISDWDSLRALMEGGAVAGDTVLIRGGTYYAYGPAIVMENSGTEGNPIVFKGYGTEIVIIDQSGHDGTNGNAAIGWKHSEGLEGQRHYIHFENIEFSLDGQLGKPQHHFSIHGNYNKLLYCTMHGSSHTAVQTITGNHNQYKGNEVFNHGYNAFSFESRAQFEMPCDNNTVEFNYIHDGTEHFGLNGFPRESTPEEYIYDDDFYLDGHIYRYNVIDNTQGCFFRYYRDLQFYGNIVMRATKDGIAFATGGSFQPDLPYGGDNKIYNNIFSQNEVVHNQSWTFYAIRDMTSNKHNVINNIFYRWTDYGQGANFQLGFGSETDDNISNNVFWNASGNQNLQYMNAGNVNGLNALPHCSNNIWGNPLFTDYDNKVLTLTIGSPCLDAGLTLDTEFSNAIIETQFPFITFELEQRTGAWDIGVYEGASGPDIIPPEVTGAVLLDSVTLVINFTEALEESGAENTNNYSITPNLVVLDASLSGANVTLTTDVHTPGLYTVTVNNVKDLAGNTILPSANSADYEWEDDPLGIFTKFTIVEATASSTPEPEHSPDKAIDGNGFYSGDPDSRWAGIPMPQWLQFDLGTPQPVSATRLSFYNFNGGRIYNFSIQVSNDETNWQEVVSNASSSSDEWTINEFDVVQTRFVRIIFNSSNQNDWAGMWEGEIWGVIPTNEDGLLENQPDNFELYQNYPNPFNPNTKIKFLVPEKTNVIIKVHNSIGQEVAELTNSNFTVGVHEVDFNASGLASGIYFYSIIAGGFVDTKKMILMK